MIGRKVVYAVKYVMPHGLMQQLQRSQRRRLVAAHKAPPSGAAQRIPYSYNAAVEFHAARGLPRADITGGSMPESTLAFCSKTLDDLIPATRDKPLVGLHVGNFLGVSLSHFVNYVRQRNEKSVVVSIDPDLTHRGIEHPQKHVIAILNHFGLQGNAMICVGYSTSKSISNDGTAFMGENGSEYDPYARFESEQSCEDALSNFCALSEGKFDFAVLDGNHEGSYLQRETAVVRRLLKPNGILILDDVNEAWAEIKAEFDNLSSKGWRSVAADGRVGVLQSGLA